jgi:hypothetical protein
MAGLTVPNLPTYYRDSAVRTARAAEYPAGTSFTDGANNGGCAGPGIGIATGEVDPKMSNAPRVSPTYGTSQYIGLVPGANGRIEVLEAGPDINDQVALVVAAGAVAPDAIIANSAVNKTGVAMVAGQWAWGVITVA